MKLPLVTNKDIRESDRGQVMITPSEVRSFPKDQIFDVLSKEYTRMVQDNPEHTFAIIHDGMRETIMISWTRRI